MKMLNSYLRPNVKVYELLIAITIMFVYGFIGGTYLERDKQIKINNQLKTEYETLKINYDDLDIDLHQQLRECESKLVGE